VPVQFGTVLDGVPPELWTQARQAPFRLLLLDLDGTLAPFTLERDDARVLPASRFWLNRIAERERRTEIGILSGRPIAEVATVLDSWRGLLVGEHGWETREPGRALARIDLDPAVDEALSRATALALLGAPDVHLERKRCSVVVHTRGLEPARARATEIRIAGLWSRAFLGRSEPTPRLVLDVIDGGLELRAAGQDRGLAIDRLLRARPPFTFVVYLGDDQSDEDAFRTVRQRGFGLRIGKGGEASFAQGRLDDPEAVSLFLAAWWFRVEVAAIGPASVSALHRWEAS